MSHYRHHVFFCCNQRESGAACCNDHGASEVRDYAKKRVKALGLSGELGALVVGVLIGPNALALAQRLANGPIHIHTNARDRVNDLATECDGAVGFTGIENVVQVLVVYPEAVWYTYVDRGDIDEIIDEHLLNGRPVERLRV